MEAVRPAVKKSPMIGEVVSLLLTILMRILGELWGVAETIQLGAFLTLGRGENRIRPTRLGDYTYLYNHSTIFKAWQRRPFFTSPGWTLSSWLSGRFRMRNLILRRRSSGRAFLGSCSIRRSTVSSTISKAPTRYSLTEARSSGPSPAIRDCEDYSRVVSGSA